jgi:hypothetical protein
MLHALGWMGTTEREGGAVTRRGGGGGPGKGKTEMEEVSRETFVDTDGDSDLMKNPVQGELAMADI